MLGGVCVVLLVLASTVRVGDLVAGRLLGLLSEGT